MLHADQQQVAQGVGEAALVRGDGQFLDEEGVAVGALEDLVDEVGGGLGAQDAGELPGDLGAAEAAQLDAPDDAQPVELGEQGAQRVPAVDVVGTERGDDDDAGGGQGPQQEGEQVPGGGVGPVQVLQDEGQGAGRRPGG